MQKWIIIYLFKFVNWVELKKKNNTKISRDGHIQTWDKKETFVFSFQPHILYYFLLLGILPSVSDNVFLIKNFPRCFLLYERRAFGKWCGISSAQCFVFLFTSLLLICYHIIFMYLIVKLFSPNIFSHTYLFFK